MIVPRCRRLAAPFNLLVKLNFEKMRFMVPYLKTAFASLSTAIEAGQAK